MTSILTISLQRGGAERQISLLASQINFSKIILLENAIDYQITSAPIITINSKTKMHPALKFIQLFFSWHKLAQALKTEQTILSFMTRANLINLLAKFFFKHKAIISERTQPSSAFQHGLKKIQKFLIKKLYPKADLIITNSQGTKLDLIQNFAIPANKIQVISNMLDLTYIQQQAQESIPKEYLPIFQRPVIINIGRQKTAKGQIHLIQAFQQTLKKQPNLNLLILGGSGEKETEIAELITKSNLTEHVFLLGDQQNPFKFLKKAQIFVLSSLWEGFPNVLIEAMACGLPVIAADCPSGPREILAPDTNYQKQTTQLELAQNGILVPALNHNTAAAEAILSQAMLTLLSDTTLALNYQKASLQRAADFSIQNIIPQWKAALKIS
jgi:glycosyltransferase involved in cell wall biosynthesis